MNPVMVKHTWASACAAGHVREARERNKVMRTLTLGVLLLAVSAGQMTGCTTTTSVQRGAIGGAALGGLTGQLLGGDTESTLIGAGIGALGGALMNDYRNNR